VTHNQKGLDEAFAYLELLRGKSSVGHLLGVAIIYLIYIYPDPGSRCLEDIFAFGGIELVCVRLADRHEISIFKREMVNGKVEDCMFRLELLRVVT